jgi:hypothetical protein
MTASRGRPSLASDAWMLEQQVRAEMEAEAWRQLREHLAAPIIPVAVIPAEPANDRAFDHHRTGSTILKAIVRFALATFAAYLGWLAAVDSQLGEFEVWLATGSSFLVMLALSMFGPARDFVHMLAETARWAIISAVALGALWMMFQMA